MRLAAAAGGPVQAWGGLQPTRRSLHLGQCPRGGTATGQDKLPSGECMPTSGIPGFLVEPRRSPQCLLGLGRSCKGPRPAPKRLSRGFRRTTPAPFCSRLHFKTPFPARCTPLSESWSTSTCMLSTERGQAEKCRARSSRERE